MARAIPHAKIVNDRIVKYDDLDPDGPFREGQDGNPVWRPFIDDGAPRYDASYQTVTYVDAIYPTEVIREYTIIDQPLQPMKDDYKSRLDEFLNRKPAEYQHLIANATYDDLVATFNGYSITVARAKNDIDNATTQDEISQIYLDTITAIGIY